VNLRIYYNKFLRKGRVYIFTGGDEATREFLLAELLQNLVHSPMDRSFARSLPEAKELIGYPPLVGQTRVVVLRDCPDPLMLEDFQEHLKAFKWLCLVVTSPKAKVNTQLPWPQWVIHKGGVWVQLKSVYGSEELIRMLEARHTWSEALAKAVVERSVSIPAAVLANANLIWTVDAPTVRTAEVLLRGGPSDVFAFADAFMLRDIAQAIRLNVNPQAAMGAIYHRVDQVYRLISYRNRGFTEWDALAKMQVPPFMREQIIQMSRKWSAAQLIHLLERLTEYSLRARENVDGVIELLILETAQ
jgi:hypothetical protein